MWNPLRNARSKAHYGLSSDIAALSEKCKGKPSRGSGADPTKSTSSELQDPQN
jgi:hypothetical protein